MNLAQILYYDFITNDLWRNTMEFYGWGLNEDIRAYWVVGVLFFGAIIGVVLVVGGIVVDLKEGNNVSRNIK